MKYFMTGATGFIGGRAAKLLVQAPAHPLTEVLEIAAAITGIKARRIHAGRPPPHLLT